MPRLRLAALLVVGALPAAAQTTGVPACDAFLDAYARCAASPGVPEAARPGLLQGIEGMRGSFRQAASVPGARQSLAASCLQTHGQVRQAMMGSFKCDFPESASVADAAPAPEGSAPVGPAIASADAQEAAKANAWVEAQNGLVQWFPLNKELATYLDMYNRSVPPPGAKPNRNAEYSFNIGNFDTLLEQLRTAQATPGTVAGVDEAGGRLIAALDSLNPLIKQLTRYRSTRDYQEDGFKLAREQHPALVSGMRAAIKAAALFSAALRERELARDAKRLQTLAEGSLPRLLLQASLDARRVLAQVDLLEPGDDTAAAAAVSTLADSARALHNKLDGMTKPSSYCTDFARHMDAMVGDGRELLHNLRNRSDVSGDEGGLVVEYNGSVNAIQACQREMARAD